MPELPEVETVRNTLKNFIVGKTITDIIVYFDNIIKNISVEEFKLKLINQTFSDIRRYGKYLLFDFENVTLTSHLRMEGKYFIKDSLQQLTKHEHIAFRLDNGQYLTYHDVRKFGTMELTPLKQESTLKSISVLGKEVNSDDLTVTYLYPLIKKANRPIKSLLLDQHIITGLGNIYVDETLFKARIHPETKGTRLSYYQVEKIIKAAKEVISKAIALGGTTIRTYQSSLGVDGRFQNELNVHTLAGEKCKNCNDIIKKIRVGGRGTYFCPTCQKKNGPLIIGLTGGIASGKSLATKWFKNHELKVLDADKIYKKLLKNNKIMYNKIATCFGNEVIKDNQIDTYALGKLIFNDSKKRELLNSITHPFVMEEINSQIYNLNKNGYRLIFLDIPLLFEVNWDYICNIVILVYVNQKNQTKRLMKRDGINQEMALLKIRSQMSLDKKVSKADIIVDNNQSIESTYNQLINIYQRLRSDGYVS